MQSAPCWSRGAPDRCVGCYGMALALRRDPNAIGHAYDALLESRPTAINLRWALDRMRRHLTVLPPEERAAAAYVEAAACATRTSRSTKPSAATAPT